MHKASTHLGSADQSQGTAPAPITNAPVSKEVSDFDEFDPRGSVAGRDSSFVGFTEFWILCCHHKLLLHIQKATCCTSLLMLFQCQISVRKLWSSIAAK